MPDATQQLGVDFSATGLRNILKNINDLTAATARAEKSFASMYKAAGGGRGTKGMLALTGTPNVAVSTTGSGTSRVSHSAGKINIAVMVRVSGGGQLTPAGQGGRRIATLANPRGWGKGTSAWAAPSPQFSPVSGAPRARRKGSSPFSALSKAIRSTRFNVGGVSPLIGQTMNAVLSPLSMLGPEGEIAKEAIEAIVVASTACAAALYGLAKASADAGIAFNRISLDLGSGPGDTAKLMALGNAVGIGGSGMASIANSIQANITGGGMGTAAGLRLGVYNLPGMFGNQDYGSQALTVIHNLRKIKDPNQRIALARQIAGGDAPALLQAASLQGKDAALLDSTSATTAHVMDAKMQADALAFQSASGMVAQAFENLAAAAGQDEMEQITSAFRGLTNILNMGADFIKNHQQAIDLLTGAAEQANPLVSIALNMGRLADNGKALADNTAATERNTQATLLPGTYGRIERQGSTTPEMFNGQQFQQGRDMAARRLSAY